MCLMKLSLMTRSLNLQVRNEGATLDKTYHQAALSMWPKKHRLIVMGVDTSISELESSCKKLVTPDCEPDAQQQQECEVMAKEIIAASKNSLGWLNSNAAVTLLACLRQLKAASLTSEFLQAIAVDRASCLSYQSFSKGSHALLLVGNSYGLSEDLFRLVIVRSMPC